MSNSTLNTLPLGVYNAVVPKEGPRIIPVNVDLTSATSALVDLTNQQQSGKITNLQGVMVDNSLNPQEVTITAQISNQKLVIPPYSQAILPMFVVQTPKFIVASTGDLIIPVFFFNIPLGPCVWGNNGGFTFTGGKLLVSDPALEALIADLGGGAALNVNVVSGGGGGGSSVGSNDVIAVNQSQFKFNSTGTSRLNDHTPGSGQNYYFTQMSITLSGDATYTGGIEATITLKENSSGNQLFQQTYSIPGTATGVNQILANIVWASPLKQQGENDYPSISITYTGNIDASLTTGDLCIQLYGFIQ